MGDTSWERRLLGKLWSNGDPPSAPVWYSAGGALGRLWGFSLTRGIGRGSTAGSEGPVGVRLELARSGVDAGAVDAGAVDAGAVAAGAVAAAALLEG